MTPPDTAALPPLPHWEQVPADIPAAIAPVKAALRARIAASGRTVEDVFAVVERQVTVEVDEIIAARDRGDTVWPVIDYADIEAGTVPAEAQALLRRRGCLLVRPSDFEDAELADPRWAKMPVQVDVTEELGSEIHVIFTIDAPIVEHSSLSQAITDEDDDSAIALAEGKSQWTARVAGRSHVKSGHRFDLAVDTASLHFFDPGTGLAIGGPVAA